MLRGCADADVECASFVCRHQLSKLPLFEDDIPWMEDSQTVEVVVLKGSKDGTRWAHADGDEAAQKSIFSGWDSAI
jgi:hypothetical protein